MEKRFLREARAQAQIQHDHICKIYEVGAFAGKNYIAMQLIIGSDLEKAAAEMTLEEKCRVMEQVADAVHAAHRLGIVHRDLKPGNIMMEQTDTGWRPYVLDFGLAREISVPGATVTGLVMGTPSYMSPEQAWGKAEQLDRRTDVYGLGATFYQILSGRLPFEGNTFEVLVKLAKEDPSPLRKLIPNLPRELETIVMKCLEKDPQFRYDSARVLAEDLRRYLDGEPIQATPPTLMYTLRRKAVKHRAIVGTSIAALIAVLIFAGLWIQSRWQAGKQALLAQELGMEVQRTEGNLRSIYTLPLHDVRGDKAKISANMEQMIRAIAQQSGNIGRLPAQYASGRVYLALQDYDKARVELESAWKQGYRTPDAALALGLVFGKLYQREILKIERSALAEEKTAARERIEKLYRVPALLYLKEAQGQKIESNEYVKGLIAFYEKKYDSAMQSATLAFRQIPWLYEAKILEGDIRMARGNESLIRGDTPRAKDSFHKAEEAYRFAAGIGQSDVRTYQGSCSAWNNLYYIDYITRSAEMPALLLQATQSCSQALQADPDSGDVYSQIARTLYFSAAFQTSKGQDASSTIEKSLNFAQQAIGLNPKDASAFLILGIDYWEKGKMEMVQGKDPHASLQHSIDASREAIRIDPKSLSSYNTLGLAYMELSNYEMGFGKDPSRLLKEAIHAFGKAIELNPSFVNATSNLGLCYYLLGRYEMDHGNDPSQAMEQAIAALSKGKEMSPNFPFNRRWLLTVYSDLGEYHYWRGEDSEKEFMQAEQNFEAGLKLNNTEESFYDALSTVYLTRAAAALDRKQSPDAALEKARSLIKTALSINPISDWNYGDLARASLIEAQWRILTRRDPSPALDEAKHELEKALHINAQSASSYQWMAESYFWRAQWALDRGHSPVEFVRQGLSLLDQSEQLDPSNAEPHALRARFFLLSARDSKDPLARQKAARESQQQLQKALDANANLKRLYASDLQQITEMLSASQ